VTDPEDHRLASDSGPPDPADDAFRSVTAFVEHELEFVTSHYDEDYLRRRFASRMRRLGVTTYDDYLGCLVDDPEEQRNLLDALSINVTGFFRDPEVWEGVREVLRELSAECHRVAAWSAGCADGREPYSLVMLADVDPEIDDARLDVVATDINEAAVDSARRGVYEPSHTTDIEAELDFLAEADAYVDRFDDGGSPRYAVVDGIRRAVSFQRHDVIGDDPKSDLDLVLCRNLSIYIDSEYKATVVDAVRRSLRPGGYLVIGQTETIPRSLRDSFTVYDGDRRIYRHTPVEETPPGTTDVDGTPPPDTRGRGRDRRQAQDRRREPGEDRRRERDQDRDRNHSQRQE
jgi:chemotaxis protein methyltransferase CheR